MPGDEIGQFRGIQEVRNFGPMPEDEIGQFRDIQEMWNFGPMPGYEIGQFRGIQEIRNLGPIYAWRRNWPGDEISYLTRCVAGRASIPNFKP